MINNQNHMKINQPYSINEIGKRQNQEDSIFPAKNKANSKQHFFLVCDGMGGHENGEIASQNVCESFNTFLKTIQPEDFNQLAFEQALTFVYDELDKKDKSSEYSSKMGTTLTFLHLNEKEVLMAHIGDSRIYHIRTQNGKAEIIYKTSDHSLVNELVRAEVISAEEAKNHPKKNVITRAMQPHQGKRDKADIYTTKDVKAGDYFFLCSDGVTESVDDRKLIEIIAGNAVDKAKIQAISQLCLLNSKDNYSAYLIPVAEGIIENSLDAVNSKAVELAEEAKLQNESHSSEDNSIIPPKAEKKQKLKIFLILFILLITIAAVGAFILFKDKLLNNSNEIQPGIEQK